MNVKFFDVANVTDIGEALRVNFVTVSSIEWALPTQEFPILNIPVSSAAAELIRQKQNEGKEVTITKDWAKASNEVLIFHLIFNDVINLDGYKKRANSYIKMQINHIMANVNASVIYGFNVINNKFLEAGVVFSEHNRSLKYIEVMERADENEETNPEFSEELMSLLEKYIEYRETLDRSYFAWDLSEEYVNRVLEVEPEHELLDTRYLPKMKTVQNISIDQEAATEDTEVKEANLKVYESYMRQNKAIQADFDGKIYVLFSHGVEVKTEEFQKVLEKEDAEILNYLNEQTLTKAKMKVDEIVKEYLTKVNTLNNLK